ncbi:hypothetical protein [Paenibacillus sp. FJAT-27812]|uniref:hypothetical protein n=1 Tax=Paenibacillus sp. FJAT-27812 TaxID=1684143 RepID=UPI0006A7638B|nr:hypothetical protein [Paenibacillus sp. FJAT-27812]
MLCVELRRLSKNKLFYVAVSFGVIIGLIGLFPYYSDTSYYKIYQLDTSISAFEAWLYCLGLGSGAMLQLLLPLLIGLPYCDSFLHDKKTGYSKAVLARVSFAKYMRSKIVVNFLAGGLTAIAILFILFLIVAALFPLHLPNTDMNFVPQGPGAAYYQEHPFPYILFIIGTNAVFGGLYGILGFSFSALLKNRYAVMASPFLFYMGLLVISEVFHIKIIDPVHLIAAYSVQLPGMGTFVWGYGAVVLISCILIMKLIRETNKELIQ